MDSRIDDEMLQRYFDGDLLPAEAASVRQQIERSPADQERLRQLERMRQLLRTALSDLGELQSEALFEGVRKVTGNNPPLRVIAGGSATRRRVGFAVAALAAAAAVVFILTSKTEHAQPREALVAQPVPPPVRSPSGSQVEEVDFGMNAGTVFAVEGESGQSLAVIWINDDKVLQ